MNKLVTIWNPVKNKQVTIRSKAKANDLLVLSALKNSERPLKIWEISWKIFDQHKIYKSSASVRRTINDSLEPKGLVVDEFTTYLGYSITLMGRKILEDFWSS